MIDANTMTSQPPSNIEAEQALLGVVLSDASGTAWAHIGTLIKPAVAGGERHDLRLADHGHSVDVEGVERLARRQSRADKMRLDTRNSCTASSGGR